MTNCKKSKDIATTLQQEMDDYCHRERDIADSHAATTSELASIIHIKGRMATAAICPPTSTTS